MKFARFEAAEKNAPKVIQWIGISCDEAGRMKPSRQKYITNIWPLIEKEMSRGDCVKWMSAHGYPTPPKSACSFCPYHDDAEWLRLKTEEPEAFEQSVHYERRLQMIMKQVTGFRGVPWLHKSMKPLSEVVFNPALKKTHYQANLKFTNECEGMCGV